MAGELVLGVPYHEWELKSGVAQPKLGKVGGVLDCGRPFSYV